MYRLTDEQVDYILNDIRRNGIETEDLQLNLLDHICCIIEQNFEENGDFEAFYAQTIKRFYKHELAEIEEETLLLSTFKNYYQMKKAMMATGVISVAALLIGSFFKFMHWPGAGVLLFTGILMFALFFLPLLAVLKLKEVKSSREKLVLRIATVAGIMYCISHIFLIQHWPGARILWLSTLAVSFFVLIPTFFFTGVRNAETKANTIVITVLLVAVTGIQFTMTALKPSPQAQEPIFTYLQTEQLLKNVRGINNGGPTMNTDDQLALDIQGICEQLKQQLLLYQFGSTAVPKDYEHNLSSVKVTNAARYFFAHENAQQLLTDLKKKVTIYNASQTGTGKGKIPIENSILDANVPSKYFCTTLYALNNVAQIQLYLACTNNSKQFSMN